MKDFDRRTTCSSTSGKKDTRFLSDEDEGEIALVQKEKARRWIPGTQVSSKYIRPKDMEWRDMGSGTMAKTFKGVDRLWVTTKRTSD